MQQVIISVFYLISLLPISMGEDLLTSSVLLGSQGHVMPRIGFGTAGLGSSTGAMVTEAFSRGFLVIL
jgi:hypothetical protein